MVNQFLIPSLKDDDAFQLELMQDGASIHTSAYTSEYLTDNKVNLLPNWPAYSPDINPIENVWAFLKSDLKKKYRSERLPKENYQFYNDACFFFHKICNRTVDSLISSMSDRLKDIKKSKELNIKMFFLSLSKFILLIFSYFKKAKANKNCDFSFFL